MNVMKYLQTVCMCLILLLGVSCTEQLEDAMTTDGGAVVKAVLSEYHTDKGEASVDGENAVHAGECQRMARLEAVAGFRHNRKGVAVHYGVGARRAGKALFYRNTEA